MAEEIRQLRSWRQRVGQPLKGGTAENEEKSVCQNRQNRQNPDLLRVGSGKSGPAKTQDALPKPPIYDLAYWMTRCFKDGCHNEPTPDPRWLGKWCQPCAARLAADTEANHA